MRTQKKQKVSIVLIVLLIISILIFIGTVIVMPALESEPTPPEVVTEVPTEPVNPQPPKEVIKTKEYVPIVFIGKNENGEEVYKIVKREYDKNVDGTKLKFAITSLIMGPVQSERANGIYSEVPTGTALLDIIDKNDKIIINLSSGFVYGGGTDSVYKRLFQLIKTVTRNTDKPAYLHIDGKQADVIGGDGIMITQPLSENSIGE